MTDLGHRLHEVITDQLPQGSLLIPRRPEEPMAAWYDTWHPDQADDWSVWLGWATLCWYHRDQHYFPLAIERLKQLSLLSSSPSSSPISEVVVGTRQDPILMLQAAWWQDIFKLSDTSTTQAMVPAVLGLSHQHTFRTWLDEHNWLAGVQLGQLTRYWSRMNGSDVLTDQLLQSIPRRQQRRDLVTAWLSNDPLMATTLEQTDHVRLEPSDLADDQPFRLYTPIEEKWRTVVTWLEPFPSRRQQIGLMLFGGGQLLRTWNKAGLAPVKQFFDAIPDMPLEHQETARLLASLAWLSSYYYRSVDHDPHFATQCAAWLHHWQTSVMEDPSVNVAERLAMLGHLIDRDGLARQRHKEISLVSPSALWQGLAQFEQALREPSPTLQANDVIALLIAVDALPRDATWYQQVRPLLTTWLSADNNASLHQADWMTLDALDWQYQFITAARYRGRYLRRVEQPTPDIIHPHSAARLLTCWCGELITHQQLPQASLKQLKQLKQLQPAHMDIGVLYRLVQSEATNIIPQQFEQLHMESFPILRDATSDERFAQWLLQQPEAVQTIVRGPWLAMSDVPLVTLQWRYRQQPTVEKWPDSSNAHARSLIPVPTNDSLLNAIDQQQRETLAWQARVEPLTAAGPWYQEYLTFWQQREDYTSNQQRLIDETVTLGAVIHADIARLNHLQQVATSDSSYRRIYQNALNQVWSAPDIWKYWDDSQAKAIQQWWFQEVLHRREHGLSMTYDASFSQAVGIALALGDDKGLEVFTQERQDSGGHLHHGAHGIFAVAGGWAVHWEPTSAERHDLIRRAFDHRDTVKWSGGAHKKLLQLLYNNSLIRLTEIPQWGDEILEQSAHGRNKGSELNPFIKLQLKGIDRSKDNTELFAQLEHIITFAESVVKHDLKRKNIRSLAKLKREFNKISATPTVASKSERSTDQAEAKR